MTDAQSSAEVQQLRGEMVRLLRLEDAIVSDPVEAAFAAVPRHLFAPGTPLAKSYDPHGIVEAKRDSNGLITSVMSAAHLQAVMLEQLGVEPGMKVMEIGSGGYNAALLQELVGESGQVTTVDIDPDITSLASRCLKEAGYDRVKVVLADGENGVPDGAPYDRIVITAAAWDIPPAWLEQLGEHGRLVVPLRLRGVTRSIGFDRDGENLLGQSYRLAHFVPMQGEGTAQERKAMLRDGVAIHTDDPSTPLNAQALNAALDTPRVVQWSGEANDLPDELDLFLSLNLPALARLHASKDVVEQDTVGASALLGVPTLVSEDSLAYRMRRENPDTDGYESGVYAHGPQAEALAQQYVALLQRWAQDYRRRGAATFRYLPGLSAGVASDPKPQATVIKPHGTVTVTWQ